MARLLVLAVLALCLVSSTAQTWDDNTAVQKFTYLWGRITENTNSLPWPSKFAVGKLFLESMNYSMDHVADEISPDERVKYIHSVGVVAGCQWKMFPNNTYTGIFQTGSTNCLVRISHAAQPDLSYPSDPVKGNMIPGASFKLLRDKVHSANLVFMRALTAQDSWNPFKYLWSNHVSGRGLNFAQNILKKKFETASSWPSYVGVSDFARYHEDGTQVPDSEINYPFQLLFVPTKTVTNKFPDHSPSATAPDMKDQLVASIGAGTTVWDLYALSAPYAKPQKIGEIATTSAFTKTLYGDQNLFIKHQRFEEDLKLKPEWLGACPDMDSCDTCPNDVNCF